MLSLFFGRGYMYPVADGVTMPFTNEKQFTSVMGNGQSSKYLSF